MSIAHFEPVSKCIALPHCFVDKLAFKLYTVTLCRAYGYDCGVVDYALILVDARDVIYRSAIVSILL